MDPFVLAWPLAVRTAHELGDREALDELLALLDGHYDGELPLMVRAERRLATARRVLDAKERVAAIEDAVTELRAAGSPYHLALGLLDLAEPSCSPARTPRTSSPRRPRSGPLGSPRVTTARRTLAGG